MSDIQTSKGRVKNGIFLNGKKLRDEAIEYLVVIGNRAEVLADGEKMTSLKIADLTDKTYPEKTLATMVDRSIIQNLSEVGNRNDWHLTSLGERIYGFAIGQQETTNVAENNNLETTTDSN